MESKHLWRHFLLAFLKFNLLFKMEHLFSGVTVTPWMDSSLALDLMTRHGLLELIILVGIRSLDMDLHSLNSGTVDLLFTPGPGLIGGNHSEWILLLGEFLHRILLVFLERDFSYLYVLLSHPWCLVVRSSMLQDLLQQLLHACSVFLLIFVTFGLLSNHLLLARDASTGVLALNFVK